MAPQKRPDSQPYSGEGRFAVGSRLRRGDFQAMPLDNSKHRKIMRATLGCAFGAVLLIAGNVGSALAGDDDDDELPDVKILRSVLHGLGLKGPNDGNEIDYRERSPLVVPPNRDLPPPQSATIKDPDWPDDPDVKRRKEQAKAEKNRPSYNFMEDSRPLRPDELSKGTAISRHPTPGDASDGEQQQMPPSKLGYKENLFSSMKSIFGSSEPESAKFSGEPPRESLTEPPPGYQTPSPDQPYGINTKAAEKAAASKPITPYDRAVGGADK